VTPLDTPPGGRLTDLFASWRADIASVPMPRLVDTATAVAVVQAARHRMEADERAPKR
jgi:hypothetical protein